MFVCRFIFSASSPQKEKNNLHLLLTYTFGFRGTREAYCQCKAELCNHRALRHIRLVLPETNTGQNGDDV